jgi:4-hydroxyphenylpyruvate dioxygenase-like putative hemolysin
VEIAFNVKDMESAYNAAMDKIWELQHPWKSKEFYIWGIADQGNLSVMYWCGDALEDKWWKKMYKKVPHHLNQKGRLYNQGLTRAVP